VKACPGYTILDLSNLNCIRPPKTNTQAYSAWVVRVGG
jgi:hypothetical protein